MRPVISSKPFSRLRSFPLKPAGGESPPSPLGSPASADRFSECDKARPSDPAKLPGQVQILGPDPVAGPRKVATVEGITEYRLHNGLRVLLFPDDSKPKVTVNITYLVGSRDEGAGEAGMAHLLEHMMFKGTPTHQKIGELLEARGGDYNATTWVDRTNYFETLPASEDNLRFALALEADRMANARLTAKELRPEASVVKNELEIYDDDSKGVLSEKMMATAYRWHPYGRAVLGPESDILGMSAEKMRAFYKKHYRPDNAVLVVAGKLDEAETLGMVEDTFGQIPRPKGRLPENYTEEPVQEGERMVKVRRAGEVPLVGLIYHGLPGAHPDYAAQEALVHILSAPPSGRLHKALVDAGLAAKIGRASFQWSDPGVMEFITQVSPGTSVDEVKKKMVEVVEGIAQGGVSETELSRFKASSAKYFHRLLNNTANAAVELTEYAALGDWRMLFVHRDRVQQITPEQVQRVAADFLKRDNRTVGYFLPTDAPERAPLPEKPDVAAMVENYRGGPPIEKGEAFVASCANIEARTVRGALPNGMKTAVLAKKNRGNAVTLTLSLRLGNAELLAGKGAARMLMADQLLSGTAEKSKQAVIDALDRLKATVSVAEGGGLVDPNRIAITMHTVKDSLPELIELLAEVTQRPSFPEAELQASKTAIVATYEAAKSSPESVGYNALAAAIDPLPRGEVGHVQTLEEAIASLRAVDRHALTELHRLCGGNNAEVAVVGDCDAEATQAKLAESFGAWRAPIEAEEIPSRRLEVAASSQVLRIPDSKVAWVGLGQTLALSTRHPDFPAIMLANHILGGAERSRLNQRIRERGGLSYSVYSQLSAHPSSEKAILVGAADCPSDQALYALSLMEEELLRLREAGVATAELDEAKQQLVGNIERGLGADGNLAGRLCRQLQRGGTMEGTQALLDRLRALTAEEVNAAMRRHIDPARFSKVAAGDLPAA